VPGIEGARLSSSEQPSRAGSYLKLAKLGQLAQDGHLLFMAIGEATAIEATVRSAATGDQVAFSRLVAEHHASMARVAFVVCGDEETTRDAVQSAWAIAWRRIGSLRDPAHVHAWLVAIAANEARQAVRRRRRVTIVDLSEQVAGAEGTNADTWLELVDLQRVLRGLKPEERGLLAMRFAAGLESMEIAEQLGMSASGVRSRLARLLDRLRVDLALDLEGDG
jgi:RNA polymerase sigma-70 factor, ECF subfamily